MATRTLEVVVTGDASGAQKAMGQTEQAAGSMESKLGKISQKLSSVGQSMTLGVTLPIVGAGVVMGKWASDAAENANKVAVVFGENASTVMQWAKDAETAFGLSEGQAAGFFGSVGTMLQGFGIDAQVIPDMSKSILTLASDLGSFHNIDTAEVMDMISASFRGEYDSIQRVIPTINAAAVATKAMAMTGKTNADELTSQEKALATYQLMLEGAGPATGDFARTQDGAANATRIAQAQIRSAGEQIGQVFMPIVAAVAGKVAEWADAFANLDDRTKTIIVAVAATAAVLGPLVLIAGKVIAVVQGISAAMSFLAANPVFLVIAAIVAIVAALVLAYQKFDWFRNAVDAVWDAIQKAAQWAWENVLQPVFEAIGGFIQDKVIPAWQDFQKGVEIVWPKIVAAAQWAWDTVLKPIFDAIGWYITNLLIPWYQMLWNIVQTVWNGIATAISWAWSTVIQPIWNAIWAFAETVLVPMFQQLWDNAQTVWNGISSAVSFAWNSVIQPIWGAISGFISGTLVPQFQNIWGVVQSVWSGIGSAISFAWNNVIQPVWNAIQGAIDTLRGAFDSLGNGVRSVWDGIGNAVRSALQAVKDAWNNTVGGKGISIPGFLGFDGVDLTIPRLHTGGVFEAPTPAGQGLALLRDGERVLTPTQHAAGMATQAPIVYVDQSATYNIEGSMVTKEQLFEETRSHFIKRAKITPGAYLPSYVVG